MLRVFTAFSGYDSQCMALDRIGIDYDLVGWSEIDRFAIRAHDAVYPQYADRNFGDITEIDPDALPDFDLMTYSSPCQDFSIAGRQRSGEYCDGRYGRLDFEITIKRLDKSIADCKNALRKAEQRYFGV
jgi:site-specific DNA-cytosine methylase